jgi:DNA-binding transcriptional ArsR family regulator
VLKNVPAIADFRTKILILLLQGKGSPTRFKIMKALRISGGPLTNGQLSARCGVNCSSIRLHLDTLIASEIITRTRTNGMSNYGMLYSLSPLTNAHLTELDVVLATCKEPIPTLLTWHDYGACCKACARGYDTPRYSEPCVSCKVARSNFVPRGDKDVKM